MKLKDLLPINEIEFRNQKEFDKYSQKHDLRPDTKVKIAGKTTTAGQAAKDSKGTSVFGKGGSVFGSASNKGKGNDKFDASPLSKLQKKYAKLPKHTMSLASTIEADGKSPEIKTQVTYDFYRMKSNGSDLFMSRKQSKKIFKALAKGVDVKVGPDENENDDKFPAVEVKKTKNGMVISTGGESTTLTKKQAVEVAEDIETSFF